MIVTDCEIRCTQIITIEIETFDWYPLIVKLVGIASYHYRAKKPD